MPPLLARWLFLALPGVLAGHVIVPIATAAEGGPAGRDYYEWRTYQLDSEAQQRRVLAYLEGAALPAWKRAGVGPVGVFTEVGESATRAVHVLLTFDSLEVAAAVRTSLANDSTYQRGAAAYLAAGMDAPAFNRIESTWLIAFADQPRLVVPEGAPRFYEMRTYESHSEAKAASKIDMFNDGEIGVFRDAGFGTVFFGESLVGPRLPNLKYLVASTDQAANEASWIAFRKHPDWVAMKDLPKYADTVSNIVKRFLTPTAFSEI